MSSKCSLSNAIKQQNLLPNHLFITNNVSYRFDLIFLLLDPQDEDYDKKLARHLVSTLSRSHDDEKENIRFDSLKDYIGYARKTFNPALTERRVKH